MMAGAKYAKTQVPTTASAPNHGLSAHPICQEVGVEHTTQRSGSDSAPGACESKRIEDFLRLLSLLPLRKCLAASGSRWAAATAVSAMDTDPIAPASSGLSLQSRGADPVSQAGSSSTGGECFPLPLEQPGQTPRTQRRYHPTMQWRHATSGG